MAERKVELFTAGTLVAMQKQIDRFIFDYHYTKRKLVNVSLSTLPGCSYVSAVTYEEEEDG
jgi:hypothetical protein